MSHARPSVDVGSGKGLKTLPSVPSPIQRCRNASTMPNGARHPECQLAGNCSPLRHGHVHPPARPHAKASTYLRRRSARRSMYMPSPVPASTSPAHQQWMVVQPILRTTRGIAPTTAATSEHPREGTRQGIAARGPSKGQVCQSWALDWLAWLRRDRNRLVKKRRSSETMPVTMRIVGDCQNLRLPSCARLPALGGRRHPRPCNRSSSSFAFTRTPAARGLVALRFPPRQGTSQRATISTSQGRMARSRMAPRAATQPCVV